MPRTSPFQAKGTKDDKHTVERKGRGLCFVFNKKWPDPAKRRKLTVPNLKRGHTLAAPGDLRDQFLLRRTGRKGKANSLLLKKKRSRRREGGSCQCRVDRNNASQVFQDRQHFSSGKKIHLNPISKKGNDASSHLPLKGCVVICLTPKGRGDGGGCFSYSWKGRFFQVG